MANPDPVLVHDWHPLAKAEDVAGGRQVAARLLGYKLGDFPIAECAAKEVLALPIYPELRDDEVETVMEGIRRFYA